MIITGRYDSLFKAFDQFPELAPRREHDLDKVNAAYETVKDEFRKDTASRHFIVFDAITREIHGFFSTPSSPDETAARLLDAYWNDSANRRHMRPAAAFELTDTDDFYRAALLSFYTGWPREMVILTDGENPEIEVTARMGAILPIRNNRQDRENMKGRGEDLFNAFMETIDGSKRQEEETTRQLKPGDRILHSKKGTGTVIRFSKNHWKHPVVRYDRNGKEEHIHNPGQDILSGTIRIIEQK